MEQKKQSFWDKLKKKKEVEKLDDTMRDAIRKTLQDTLESVLRLEYKVDDGQGNAVIDYELTTRMMKTQARLALKRAIAIRAQRRWSPGRK